MTTKPAAVWLLDVDGVLNLFDAASDAWPDATRFTSGNGFPITWSPVMLQRITAVHDSGLAEVRWLTTWGEHANTYLADVFGLPPLTVAGSPPWREGAEWWKLPHARSVFDGGAHVVWTDDDIQFSPEATAWLHDADPERILPISPHTGGLLPDDLDRVERWLPSRSAATVAL